MVMTLRAISYSRFSSARQQVGSSIERQLKLTREYCEKHNLTLDESLTDEGYSAFKGDHTARGSLGRFLQAVERGEVERGTYLIVESLDRLSRRAVRDALRQFWDIIDAGIKIVTLFDGRVYSDTSESVEIDLIVAILYMSEAHKSSLSKSKRLKQAWEIKRSNSGKPITGVCPAWLVRNPNDAPAFRENEGAAIIRRIFREAAAGIGSFSIAKRLNDEKVPALTGNKGVYRKDHPKAGQPISNGWNRGRINEIIRSDAALGWFQPHKRDGSQRVPVGEPIKHYFPEIIDQATADKARANIASRRFAGVGSGRKGDTISNLFTTVAKCERCGSSMFLVARTKASGKPGRLRCSMSVRNKQVCDSPVSVPYGKFEAAVLKDFAMIRNIVKATNTTDQTRELEQKLAEKKAEADRLKTRIDEMSSDLDIPFAVIKNQIATMSERHAQLTSELETLDRQLNIERSARRDIDDLEKRFITERLQSSDPNIVRKARSELSMAIRHNLKTITCDPEKVRLISVHLAKPEGGRFSVCFEETHGMGIWLGATEPDGTFIEARVSTTDEFRGSVKADEQGGYVRVTFGVEV